MSDKYPDVTVTLTYEQALFLAARAMGNPLTDAEKRKGREAAAVVVKALQAANAAAHALETHANDK